MRMTREGGGGRCGVAGVKDFFNGIFKDGFKLEVINMCKLKRRKSKNVVLVCDCVSVRANICMWGLAAITASCKHLSQPPFNSSVYQLDK